MDLVLVPVDGGELPVRRWLPEAGTGPGVVVVQEIFGLSPYILDRCAGLAEAGYVVYAPDLYWRLPSPPEFDETSPEWVAQGVAASSGLDRATTAADTSATLDALRGAPEVTGPVAFVGFCFGGGVAFEVSATNPPDALVAYYGSSLPHLLHLAPRVTCPSLHHFGTADAWIPMDVVTQIRDAVTAGRDDVEFELYDGANHAFDNPHPLFHHAEASAVAWERTLAFLARHLGSRQAGSAG